MGKQTKRARKFSSQGGVKARLDKGGTVTNKGKLKRKRNDDKGKHAPPSNKTLNDMKNQQQDEQKRKRDEKDFAGEANLGDMNLDSFFETFADKMVGDNDEEHVDKDADNDKDVDSVEDDSSDDDDSDEEQEDENEDKSDDSDDDGSNDSGDDDDMDVAEARMKREMDKLQSSDPEFHKFLSENEKSLLKFGGNDEAEKSDSEDDDDEAPAAKKSSAPSLIIVDADLLKSFNQAVFKSHGIKSLKKLVNAYKSACHLSDPNTEEADGKASKRGGKSNYHIEDSTVFDKLMVMCLSRCHKEFHYHLLGDGAGVSKSGKGNDDDGEGDAQDGIDSENKPLNPKTLAKSSRRDDVNPVLQSFLRSTLHVLSEAKEPELVTFILKALSHYVPFLTPFPRIAQGLLKTLTLLWSAPLDSSEDYQVVRLNAFLRIRQLALTQPFPFIEECLKKTYLAYANRAKFGTSSSVTSLLPTLTFMGNCVVELYSLDYHSSYQHAFVYIRQLALHLRSAMQKKTPESLQVVYCWQYVHCLKLWVAVLNASCKQDMEHDINLAGRADEVQLMRSLIFPLTEVILGVVRLLPTTRYLPLRLHCVRFLQQLAATAELYIPTTSILLEALDLKEIGLKPKKVQGRGLSRGLQLVLILKLPKESPLRTSEQLEACISEIFLLLNREVDLYRYSAGFPEFSVRICQRLRKFSKETKNGRWRAYAKGCIDMCDRATSFAVKSRSTLSEAPQDVKRLEVLKPTNEPRMGERYDVAISKEKRLEEVSRPAIKSKIEKEVLDDDDSDDNEEEIKEMPKKKRKVKAKKEVNQSDLANTGALEEVDEVAEGIDWTDDESD